MTKNIKRIIIVFSLLWATLGQSFATTVNHSFNNQPIISQLIEIKKKKGNR